MAAKRGSRKPRAEGRPQSIPAPPGGAAAEARVAGSKRRGRSGKGVDAGASHARPADTDGLERRVAQRTAELLRANRRLQEENEELLRAEQLLRLEQARLDALLRLNKMEEASVSDAAGFVLEEGIALTRSKIGFVGFMNEDESIYKLHAMSKDVVKECKVTGLPMHWPVAAAGVWADAVRQRRTIFVNDYSHPSVEKKGLPPGHPTLERFMVVPFFEGKKIVAVVGVGNKASDYDSSDERQMVLLMGGMWSHVQRNLAREALQKAYDQLERKVEERTAQLAASNATLQKEIGERRRAEEALRKSNDELEQRVTERTARLLQTVETLREEVARRIQAEEVLRQRSQQLRVLTSELTLAEQRERRRLALVLHDGLQQLLVGARLRLVLLERQSPSEICSSAAAQVTELLGEAIETSRSLSAELSPPILREAGLVPALEWLARWMQEKQGLKVELELQEPSGAIGEEVAVLVFQSTRELLFNVVKHAAASSARLRLAEHEGCLRITVADEGCGFDPSRLRAEGGTAGGLGLFNIAERLDLLGGRMEIDSAPGRGSRFMLIVPALPPERQEAPGGREELASAVTPSRGVPTREGQIRILLVDDHAIVRQGLAAILDEEHDMAVVGEAADGESAMALVRQLRPEVVLMDMSMPGMSGIETTRAIHAEFPEVQTIGLSMLDEAEQAEAMRQAGAVGYLSKAGPAEALLAAIRALPHRDS
jgi:signal transduction histidine kinase/ActR/RegA family two-component response regulator